MTKHKKFSDLITGLSEIWILWEKYNAICRDENNSIKQRKEAADACEALIDKRYEIIETLDSYFEQGEKDT